MWNAYGYVIEPADCAMSVPQDCVVAIDLGGTSLRAALVDANRVVWASTQTETLPNARAIQNQVVGVVDALLSSVQGTKVRVTHVCIGFPGVVHPQTQWIRQAPNILDASAQNLAQQLSQELGVPVVLENDVNLAALAEQDARAKDGVCSVATVSIGTGLGCGLVLNGAVWQGRDGGAGELCSLAVSHQAREFLAAKGIHHGFDQAEDLVSGKGLANLYGQLQDRSSAPHSSKQALDFRQVPQLFALAEQGDAIAMTCLDLVARETAHLIEQLEHMVNPGLYVLAGGVGSRSEFRTRVNQALKPFGLTAEASKFLGTADTKSYLGLKTAGLAGAVLTALSRSQATAAHRDLRTTAIEH
jgi:predicted NBD/HSP70 family sugar kinase